MRRRTFLSKTFIGTAGVTLGASGILSGSCKGANDKVVLALIGAGPRGTHTIINTCKVNSNVEIKTICDVQESRLARASDQIEKQLGYQPRQSRDMKEVFDDNDIDAVWISTPDHWHALATIWACQARKHVYVEKNLNLCYWEGLKMIEAAKKYKRVVQGGFQNRSAGYAASARDFLKNGKLGQIVHIKVYNLLPGNKWIPKMDTEIPQGVNWDYWLGPAPYVPFNPDRLNAWVNYWDYNGGYLNDASHQLDLVRMLMGDPGHPENVYTWGGNNAWGSEREVPEVQTIIYDYNTFTVTLDSGTATNYMEKTSNEIRFNPELFPDWKSNSCRIEIYGTEGFMYFGRQGGGWQVYSKNEKLIAQGKGIHSDEEHQINFIDCIRNNKKPNSNMEQAHLSASLVHFANIAYRTGNKQLRIDTKDFKFIDNNEANKMLKNSYRDSFMIPEKV